MSRRTRTNLPLPVIGSTGWGGTLNNYLTNQTYAQTELETEIKKIYDNRMNVAQTVLSSGIMDSSVEDFKIGLYEGDNYVTEGAQLDLTKDYHFRGWAAIVGNQNITQSFDNGDNKLIIPFSDADKGLKFGTATYDARCVYLHYDKNTTTWDYKFGDTNDPSKETKVSVHPYYICLGVVILINGNYYWHYKTMKSNISISSKKWMLDEPHANLNTYMNWISTSKSLTIHTDNSYFKNAILTIQALGINPFTETESVTNEYNSDIATYVLGENSETTDNKSFWNCVLLYCKRTETTDENGTTTTTITLEKKESETNTESLSLTDWIDDASIYRICASSLIVSNVAKTATKPVLFLQKAISGTKIDEALFDESEFGRLIYYADPVELYRIKGNVMTAAVGDGISTINANGINPHVTTLIKNGDAVRFGEATDKYYHLETSGSKPDRALELHIENPTGGNKSIILTNNMNPISDSIRIGSSAPVSFQSSSLNDGVYIGYHKDNTHLGGVRACYTDIPTVGGRIDSTIIDDKKLTRWEQDGAGQILMRAVETKQPITNLASMDINYESKIILTPNNIHLYGGSVVPVTKDFQINNGDKAYIAIQYPETNNRSTITLGTNTNKKIRLTADGGDGEKPTIELGTLGGDCTKLSSDGLYLPSGSDGIRIGKLEGATQWIESYVTLNKDVFPYLDGGFKLTHRYDYSLAVSSTKTNWKDGWLYIKESKKTDYIKCKTKLLNDSDSTIVNYFIDEKGITVSLYGYPLRHSFNIDTETGYFWLYIGSDSSAQGCEDLTIKEWNIERVPLLTVESTNSGTRIDLVNDETFTNHFHGILNMASIASDGIINLGMAETLDKCGTNHGNIYIGYNGFDGGVEMFANAGQVAVNANRNKIIINRNLYIYKNFCYFDDQEINYSSTVDNLLNKKVYINGTEKTFGKSGYFWRIYGYGAKQNTITANNYSNFGSMTWRNGWSNEDNRHTDGYIFLPDYGSYQVKLEVYDDSTYNSGKDTYYPAGTLRYNSAKTINTLNYGCDGSSSKNGVYYHKLWGAAGDEGEMNPGLYIRFYTERDRVVAHFYIDTWDLNLKGGGAYAVQVMFCRDYDSSNPYYIAPMCKFYTED